MKLSSAKPISSPSRADKFPTPLMMRFLRSNVGSRSRGRSRSSPMFIMRPKKNAAAAINDAQQEPSSPKVTCIGQVRARRSSKSKTTSRPRKRPPPSSSSSCSCSCSSSCCCCSGCCPPTIIPCCHLKTPRIRKPRSFCRPFHKFVLYFRSGYCKKIDVRDDCFSSSSSRVVVSTTQRGQNHVNSANSNSGAGDIEDNEANGGETKEDFLESSTTSPPKNALLLTRCRSAPYRSSSLASRFWGSPLGASDGTETDRSPKNELPQMPKSPNNYGDEAVESRSSNCHGESGSEELGSSSNGGGCNEATNTQEMGGSIHPVLLTRCKSEPARTGERLNPEVINYWQQRRSYATESRLQQSWRPLH